MKKTFIRLTQGIAILVVITLMFGLTVLAADKDTVVALGADLTSSQKSTVLSLMGLSEADLNDCTVVTVTNAEEHQYLDGYPTSSNRLTKPNSTIFSRCFLTLSSLHFAANLAVCGNHTMIYSAV